MKRYGLRIGNVGVEFPSLEECQKALLTFTKGTDVSINTGAGIKYKAGAGSFSTYERESSEIITTCYECKGEFSTEMCQQRTYPKKYSYGNSFSEETNWICDACLASAVKVKQVFDAQQLIAESKEGL